MSIDRRHLILGGAVVSAGWAGSVAHAAGPNSGEAPAMAQSLLFTGHMIDLPGRAAPRFPTALEPAVRARLAKAVAPYAPPKAGGTLGFASGARGGDILFHEECRRHGIGTTIVLPFAPEIFIADSVAGIPGGDWVPRFWTLWNQTPEDRRDIMGLPKSDEAYAVCNLRLHDLARRHGRVHFVALWDGKGGDGPGGAGHLVELAREGDTPDVFSPDSLSK